MLMVTCLVSFDTDPDNPPLIRGKTGLNIWFNKQSNINKSKATAKAAAGATLGLNQVLAG